MKNKNTALALLIVGCAGSYFWQLAPAQYVDMVWNITGSLYRLFLLGIIALCFRSKSVASVAVLLCVFDLMVVGCSALYMVDPWPINPGDERCSTRFNYPLGVMGAVIALILVVNIVRGKR